MKVNQRGRKETHNLLFPFTSSINAFFLPILSISEEGRFGKDVSVSSGGRPVVLVYRSATLNNHYM